MYYYENIRNLYQATTKILYNTAQGVVLIIFIQLYLNIHRNRQNNEIIRVLYLKIKSTTRISGYFSDLVFWDQTSMVKF